MANPELKENFQPDTNMELNNLKAEIANPDPNVESVPDFLTKEYSAKTANSTEIQNLKKANAM
jgi:septation ring formation regulator EzrA